MRTKIHRGAMAIEMVIVLAVVMMAGVYGINRYGQYITEMEWTVEGRRMDAIAAAAKSYIRDNRDAIQKSVSGGAVITLTPAQLQNAGYLPKGFNASNSSAQTFQVAVTRNPDNVQQLTGFVLTRGGMPLPYKGQRFISRVVNGYGGYINETNKAEGANGGWALDLKRYGMTAEAGRLAVWLTSEELGTNEQDSDRLYRYQITGRPELNRMHAGIDMNSNNLSNAGTVTAKTGTFSSAITAPSATVSGTLTASNVTVNSNATVKGTLTTTNATVDSNATVKGMLTAANASVSGTVTGPNVNATNLNAQTTRTTGETYTGGWFRTTGNTGWYSQAHGGGFYMSDSQWIRSYNDKGIYTAGQMQAGTIQSNGRMTAKEHILLEKVIAAGAACSPNGLLGRDSTGAILSCQNGKWQQMGSGEKISTYSLKFPNSPMQLGQHSLCALTYVRAIKVGSDNSYSECGLTTSGNNWVLTAYPHSYSNYRCDAVCMN